MYVCVWFSSRYIAEVSLAISYNKNMQHIHINGQLKICMHKGMFYHEPMQVYAYIYAVSVTGARGILEPA